MTVIAWDGKTLAADKRADASGYSFRVKKIQKHKGELLFAAGDFSLITTLCDWYKNGADTTKWPEFQKSKDDWAALHVIRKNGTLVRYERGHVPFVIQEKFYATGSGRDYAIAAMHLGKSAREAVAIACKFDPGCGNGIDTLTLKGKK